MLKHGARHYLPGVAMSRYEISGSRRISDLTQAQGFGRHAGLKVFDSATSVRGSHVEYEDTSIRLQHIRVRSVMPNVTYV